MFQRCISYLFLTFFNVFLKSWHPASWLSGCSVPTSRASCAPHLFKIIIDVRALGPPHVLKLDRGKHRHVPC